MSIQGAWALKMSTPMGEQSATLVLGAGGGTMTDPSGVPQPLKEPNVSGDAASWKMDVTSPMAMTVALSVRLEGDALVGEAKAPMGSAPIKGVRA